MRYIYLVSFIVFLVVGCAPDPMRAAIANERSIQANNAQAAQQAQIDRAQQADTDARNAQELLQALQAQQAIVQGQAAQAQALAQVEIAKTIAQAAKPNYTPLYVAMLLVSVLIVAYMLIIVRRTSPRSEIAPMPKLLPSPPGTELWLYPNGELQQIWIEPFDSRILTPGDPMYRKLLTVRK